MKGDFFIRIITIFDFDPIFNKNSSSEKIDQLILIDTRKKIYYRYDYGVNNNSNFKIKNFLKDDSLIYALYLKDINNIAVNENIFNSILNCKINLLSNCTKNIFLEKFMLYEWII
jgi:hypothetical protein